MLDNRITVQQACGMEVSDVCRALHIGYNPKNENRGPTGAVAGLTTAEADQRRSLYGSNELEQDEEEPLWRKFLEQFKDPMIGLLGVSALVSVLVGSYDDAISITLVRSSRHLGVRLGSHLALHHRPLQSLLSLRLSKSIAATSPLPP